MASRNDIDVMEKFFSDASIPPEVRAREREIYGGASLWNGIALSTSLVSAFSAAVVCERPGMTAIALTCTALSSGVAKLARVYMRLAEDQIRERYYGSHYWPHP